MTTPLNVEASTASPFQGNGDTLALATHVADHKSHITFTRSFRREKLHESDTGNQEPGTRNQQHRQEDDINSGSPQIGPRNVSSWFGLMDAKASVARAPILDNIANWIGDQCTGISSWVQVSAPKSSPLRANDAAMSERTVLPGAFLSKRPRVAG